MPQLLLLPLLGWIQQTPQQIGLPSTDNAIVGAVLFLLVKSLLEFIGKFMPNLVGSGATIGGHSPEYWQQLWENKLTEIMRRELAPIHKLLSEIRRSQANAEDRDNDAELTRRIEEAIARTRT